MKDLLNIPNKTPAAGTKLPQPVAPFVILHNDEDILMGLSGPLVFVEYRKITRTEHLVKMGTILHAALKSHGPKTAWFAIAAEGSVHPTGELRKQVFAWVDEFKDKICGSAMVVEGTTGLMKAGLTCCQLINMRSGAWLGADAGKACEVLAPKLNVDPYQLKIAVAEVRRNNRMAAAVSKLASRVAYL